MGNVSLKVVEKFLNFLFKKGYEPWNYFPDGLAILVERVVTVEVVCSKAPTAWPFLCTSSFELECAPVSLLILYLFNYLSEYDLLHPEDEES